MFCTIQNDIACCVLPVPKQSRKSCTRKPQAINRRSVRYDLAFPTLSQSSDSKTKFKVWNEQIHDGCSSSTHSSSSFLCSARCHFCDFLCTTESVQFRRGRGSIYSIDSHTQPLWVWSPTVQRPYFGFPYNVLASSRLIY